MVIFIDNDNNNDTNNNNNNYNDNNNDNNNNIISNFVFISKFFLPNPSWVCSCLVLTVDIIPILWPDQSEKRNRNKF